MYGPNRPLFTSSGEPHLGHFSLSNPDRSCTSWMILLMSIASSARLNGSQKSPSTACQSRSPSSTLSSSFSMFAVNPTSKTSGNDRFRTFHTVSPCGVGGLAVERVVAVEEDAGAGRAEQELSVRQLEVHLRRLVDGRGHLGCEEAPPNQLVELKEVAFQVFLEIVGRETDFGRPNRLMRVLHL